MYILTAFFKFIGIVFIILISLCVFWVALREISVLWYGPSLHLEAKRSAEMMSEGRCYCLIESQGAKTINELDYREVIVSAFNQSFGLAMMLNWFKTPHFGLKVDDSQYYWSIRNRAFVELPGYAGSNSDTPCTKDLRSTWFGEGTKTEKAA